MRSVKLGPLIRLHAKYGRWTPSITYLSPKRVFVHNTRISVCLHEHGWGCQIRNTGSLTPIFWQRTSFLCYNQAPYHFGGLGRNLSKKLIASRFSPFWHNPKFWDCFPGRWKFARHRFYWCITPQNGMPKLWTTTHESAPKIWGPNSQKCPHTSQNCGLS